MIRAGSANHKSGETIRTTKQKGLTDFMIVGVDEADAYLQALKESKDGKQ